MLTTGLEHQTKNFTVVDCKREEVKRYAIHKLM